MHLIFPFLKLLGEHVYTLPKMSISPSVGQSIGCLEANSQKAAQLPRPFGSLALISNIPYVNSFLLFNRAEV